MAPTPMGMVFGRWSDSKGFISGIYAAGVAPFGLEHASTRFGFTSQWKLLSSFVRMCQDQSACTGTADIDLTFPLENEISREAH